MSIGMTETMYNEIYADEIEHETLQAKIEAAQIAASETTDSWRDRCITIMAALGFDYGDLDADVPEEYRGKQIDQLEKELEFYREENRELKAEIRDLLREIKEATVPPAEKEWNSDNNW